MEITKKDDVCTSDCPCVEDPAARCDCAERDYNGCACTACSNCRAELSMNVDAEAAADDDCLDDVCIACREREAEAEKKAGR